MADVLDTPTMRAAFRIMLEARVLHDQRFDEHKAKFFWRETPQGFRSSSNKYEVCRYGDYPEPPILVLEHFATLNHARRAEGRWVRTYINENAIRSGLGALLEAGFTITKEQQNE